MKIDIAMLKRTAETNSETGEKKESMWWIPEQGENKIRFIENPNSSANPIGFMYKHYKVGPNEWSMWCPKSTGEYDPKKGKPKRDWNKPCPICDYVSELYKTGAEEDKALAMKIGAKERYIFNIVDLKNIDAGVRLFDCSKKLYDIIMRDWDEETPISDVQNGYNFVIHREGPRDRPDYIKSKKDKNPSPIQNMEWVNQVKDIWATLSPMLKNAEDIRNVMDGVSGRQGAETIAPAPQHAPRVASTDDDVPMFNTPKQEETKPKVKKKPDCFGNLTLGDADCEECAFEESCAEKTQSNSDLDAEELEILNSLKK